MASLGEIKQAELKGNSDVSSTLNTTMGALKSLDIEGASSGAKKAKKADNVLLNGKYDFVGINENGIEEMCTAIDTYCKNINTIIQQMVITANPEGTFAGEYASAINEFIKAMQDSCMSNVNSLKIFKQDLRSVLAAMKAKDSSTLDNITGDASSINSSINSDNVGA